MTPHQVVPRCISSGCTAWLATPGFKRKGLVFRRTVGRAAHVTDRIEVERRRRAEDFARDDIYGTAVLTEARHVLAKR